MDNPNNNNGPSTVTLGRDGPLSSKSKVECPALLSPDGSKKTPTASCHSRNSIRKSKDVQTVVVTRSSSVEQLSSNKDVTRDVESNIFNDTDNRKESSASVAELIETSYLARVDPLIDFFMVDEELKGKFEIWSNPITSPNQGRHQQALIFKVKTTSPFSFLVTPVYGLMRPNVVASIEVKCETKASRPQMELDEFLVELAPLPGAVAGMTSDLYTSTIASNYPELKEIWERIEEAAQKGSYEHLREFHRIACRFHRTSEELGMSRIGPQITKDISSEGQVISYKGGGEEVEDNNNVSRFKSCATYLCENCSFTKPAKLECYLARETRSQAEDQKDIKRRGRERCGCSTVRRLQVFNVILTLLLIISLLYIFVIPIYFFKHENETKNGKSKRSL